jgi:hypothetical protein
MRAHQFTLGPFDAVAVFHPLLKSGRLLLLPSSLQISMMLPYDQCTVTLTFPKATVTQRAAMALGAKFKTIINVSGSCFDQATALSVEVSGGTHRLPFLDIDLELRCGETSILLRPGQSWSNDLSLLNLSEGQFLRGYICRIDL